ncbi:MAG: hypothetical protein PHT91_00075 [Candidatus Nanoarchaeia archaeon]|nr:hypothetical protein [Candidatus Nanoarchaeia archaeon]MDD5054141.1 hypothetical protein [Candidatus Nanoarchaeia archaeon]MDD5499258.1 hypothetical protein [Candidatus Nanoarchaeia archaeon]
MISAKKMILKAKPFFSKAFKNSFLIKKKFLFNFKKNKISKKKLKKIVRALDDSGIAGNWTRFILLAVLSIALVSKASLYYDENKTLKENAKDVVKMIKKKRGC